MMPMRLLDRMPRAWHPDNRRELGVALIILLAAALRLGRGDLVEYFHDDAMLATLALELADGIRFPLTGILSSTGIPNSPVSVYFLALPFALSSDPAVVIHFITLWNVLGVALLWLLARRCCGKRVALLAALCYAVNPWAVLFSRKIWAQELHSPFILLGFLLLLQGFWQAREAGPGRRSVFLAQCLGMPVLIIGLQFHFASWPLALVIPIALWQGRKRISAGALIIALALSIIVCASYMLGLTQTLASDPWRISDALARSAESAPQFSSASIAAVGRLATGSGLETWLAPDQTEAARVSLFAIAAGHAAADSAYCHRCCRGLLALPAFRRLHADMGLSAWRLAAGRMDAGLHPLFHPLNPGSGPAYRAWPGPYLAPRRATSPASSRRLAALRPHSRAADPSLECGSRFCRAATGGLPRLHDALGESCCRCARRSPASMMSWCWRPAWPGICIMKSPFGIRSCGTM